MNFYNKYRMAINEITKIILLNGLAEDLPNLQDGELAHVTDRQDILMGRPSLDRSVYPHANVTILTTESSLVDELHGEEIRNGSSDQLHEIDLFVGGWLPILRNDSPVIIAESLRIVLEMDYALYGSVGMLQSGHLTISENPDEIVEAQIYQDRLGEEHVEFRFRKVNGNLHFEYRTTTAGSLRYSLHRISLPKREINEDD